MRGEFPMDEDQREEEYGFAAALWASDRTLLAWIRTALSMIGFGFAIHQFAHYLQGEGLMTHKSRDFGGGLVVLGILVLVFASVQYYSFRRRLFDRDSLRLKRLPLAFIVAVVVCISGVIAFVLLFFDA